VTRRVLGPLVAVACLATVFARPTLAREPADRRAVATGVGQEQGDGDVPPSAVQPREGRPNRPPGRGGAVPPGRGGPPVATEGLTAGQVERLFDDFVLQRARVMLQLGSRQVVPFGNRFNALQSAKRRGQRRRQQLLNELNQISRGAEPADDATLTTKLKALDEVSAQADQEVRDAYARLDEILSVRQRVGFRVLEQNMERRKLDLLAQARNAARGDGAAPAGPPPAQ